MGGVAGYVRAIGACALLMSVVSALCPKNSAKYAVELICALIIAVVLIAPLKRFDLTDISALSDAAERDIQERSERLISENNALREKIIEQKTAAYILQRAEDFGIECEAEVICRDGVPEEVNIRAEEKDIEKLSEIIKSECGISEIEVVE